VSPVEYAGGKRPLRAYIAVYFQIQCNPSNYLLTIRIHSSWLTFHALWLWLYCYI